MATASYVYRSGARDILDEYEACQAEQPKWFRKVNRLVKGWFPELSPADRKKIDPVVISGWGNLTWVGLSVPWDMRKDLLAAHPLWKEDRDGYVTPRRSGKEGKALAAVFDANPVPNIRTRLRGMPSHVFGGMSVYQPKVEMLAGKVYVVWSCELDGKDKDFDPKTWRPVKLSEYYRLVEKRDAEAAA